jgi:hypothetical protein
MGPTIPDALHNLLLRAVNLSPEQGREIPISSTPPQDPAAVVADLTKVQGWVDESRSIRNVLTIYVDELFRLPEAERNRILTALWQVLVGEMSTADRRRLLHELTAECSGR